MRATRVYTLTAERVSTDRITATYIEPGDPEIQVRWATMTGWSCSCDLHQENCHHVVATLRFLYLEGRR